MAEVEDHIPDVAVGAWTVEHHTDAAGVLEVVDGIVRSAEEVSLWHGMQPAVYASDFAKQQSLL
jgi:hypothetical protein